jgi:hypothetical protein
MQDSGGLGLADAGMEIWAGMVLLGLVGFVLGFALNRGSICTVIATRELVSDKTPARFIALVESAVWAALVYAIDHAAWLVATRISGSRSHIVRNRHLCERRLRVRVCRAFRKW